jgi:hypothetical protein
MTWKAEFNRFTQEALQEMKTYSDNTNEEREWMCYVYLDDNGQYQLGLPDYGGESAIKVSPQAKMAQDKLRKGLYDKKWTIHGHPLKDGKIYTGRQYFSSTDICREYCEARDKNEYTVQFLVFPHQQIEKDVNGKPTGKKVIHNRVRTLVFPNTQTIVAAMKESNPGVDPYAITPETGQNTNAPDGRLVNQAGVNWFAFQEALGKYNAMGIMDLEGPAYGAEGFSSQKLSMINFGGLTTVAVILGGLFVANRNKQKIIEVIDDLRN